ncbi:MAG: transglycosylase SLT domain-containing protein [Candidatus Woesearchaeota archaeon]
MGRKNIRQGLITASIITAAALSLDLTMNKDVPKDEYYYRSGPITLVDTVIPESKKYLDGFSNLLEAVNEKRKDYQTLDSLLNKAKENMAMPLVYHGTYLDSLAINNINSLVNATVNRPMINEEARVKSILGKYTDYTEVVSKDFIEASIIVESRYNPRAVSHTGAKGVMQFTKAAWKEFGGGTYLPNVYDIEKNIEAGIKFYKWMETEYASRHPKWNELTIAEKQDLLGAGYNGGPYGLIRKDWNISKMRKESRDHVVKIRDAMEKLYLEDIYRNIATYQAKVEKHKLGGENVFWLAYDAANTASFMKKNILSKS